MFVDEIHWFSREAESILKKERKKSSIIIGYVIIIMQRAQGVKWGWKNANYTLHAAPGSSATLGYQRSGGSCNKKTELKRPEISMQGRRLVKRILFGGRANYTVYDKNIRLSSLFARLGGNPRDSRSGKVKSSSHALFRRIMSRRRDCCTRVPNRRDLNLFSRPIDKKKSSPNSQPRIVLKCFVMQIKICIKHEILPLFSRVRSEGSLTFFHARRNVKDVLINYLKAGKSTARTKWKPALNFELTLIHSKRV